MRKKTTISFNRACRAMRILGHCYLTWDAKLCRFEVALRSNYGSANKNGIVIIGYYESLNKPSFVLFDYPLSRYSEDRGRLIYGGNYMRTKNKKHDTF